MYRDHPDEIIWPIRTTNGLRGKFAHPDINRSFPDMSRTRSCENEGPKTGLCGQRKILKNVILKQSRAFLRVSKVKNPFPGWSERKYARDRSIRDKRSRISSIGIRI